MGHLPSTSELEKFTTKLRDQRELHPAIESFLLNAPKDAAPMDVIRTGVSMLGLTDTRGDNQNRELNEERAMSICAKMPLMVAAFHRGRQGKDLPPIRKDLSEAGH